MNKKYIIDSRSLTIPEQTIFVAIKTKSGNGHKYIPSLFKKGVKDFIITEKFPEYEELVKKGGVFHFVEDAITELHKRACEKLLSSSAEVISVVGSRGKTIVKEWLFQLLRDVSVRSIRSYNSLIGVPLSILNQDFSSKHFVIQESGISQPGEMIRHQKMLQPSIVVLTNITKEHSEGFDSLEEKVREKLSISKEALKVVYPADDSIISSILDSIEKERKKDFIRYSWQLLPDSIRISIIDQRNTQTLTYNISDLNVNADLIEETCNKENLATVIAAGLAATNNNSDFINDRIKNLKSLDVKLIVHEGLNYNKIVVDNFATDGQSIEPTLDFIRRISPDKNKLLVIINLIGNQIDSASILEKLKIYNIKEIVVLKNQDDITELEQKDPEIYRDYAILVVDRRISGVTGELLSYFETRLYETTMEINLDSLVNNYNYFKSILKPNTEIICMLKAFGYGTGSIELAKTLQNQGVGGLAVAFIDEGIELRRNNISCPILILNPHSYNYRPLFDEHLEPVIYNFRLLRNIISSAKNHGVRKYPVHIKLETGMRRLGFKNEELEELISILNEASEYVKVSTVLSHLATADCPELDDYTEGQIKLFRSMTDKIKDGIGYPFRRHILNSAGIVRFPEAQFDIVRLGIGLYGIATVEELKAHLSPIASVYTSIISMKEWKAGDKIGYGCRGNLKRDSVIATLPIGYADGLDRRLGNGKGYVNVEGYKCPIIGSICMDICMVDVTDVPSCKIGARAEILGQNIEISTVADMLDTIPYEVLTSISHRVKRIYFRES